MKIIIGLLIVYLLLDLWRAWLTIVCNRGIAEQNEKIRVANAAMMERAEQASILLKQSDDEIEILKTMVRELVLLNSFTSSIKKDEAKP